LQNWVNEEKANTYKVYFISFWCIDLKCIINYKLIYNNNNSYNSLCPIMKSLELTGNNNFNS
jgi:hypothetical protein